MLDWFARVVRRRPKDIDGLVSNAEPCAVDDLQGQHAAAAFTRATALFDAQRWEEAALAFAAAVEMRYDWAEAHQKLGFCMYRLGRLEEAYDSFAMALCFPPRTPRIHLDLARVEGKQGKLESALASVQNAVDEGENTAEAQNVKGTLLLEAGNVDGAVTAFEEAIALEPDDARGHSNLGYLLFRERGRYAAGAAHIERAVQLDPANADYLCNLAMVVADRGEPERALALCNHLLSVRPDMHEVRLNRGLVLLKLGRFNAGWPDYEARKLVRSNYVARELPWPEWRGEPLQGKTILIHGEQGLGDEIMFASCIPEVIDRADHCVIECAVRLEPLFRRSFPSATVVAGEQSRARPTWIDGVPKIDFQIASGSLPLRLERDWGRFPQHRGYLRPEPARAKRWRHRLDELGPGLKVGLSWRGGLPSTRRTLRSIELSALVSLWDIPNTHFIDLQYGDTVEERRHMSAEHGVVIHSWFETGDDLDDTAALVSELDLVISVCTAVIHIAGALGRAVWVLVPTVPEWRYRSEGADIPWYPSTVMVRQSVEGEWAPVIGEVARRLNDRVRTTV